MIYYILSSDIIDPAKTSISFYGNVIFDHASYLHKSALNDLKAAIVRAIKFEIKYIIAIEFLHSEEKVPYNNSNNFRVLNVIGKEEFQKYQTLI